MSRHPRGCVPYLRFLCIWLLLAPLAALQAAAPSSPMELGTQDRYALSGAFVYFEDTSALLTLDEVLQPAVQARFKPVAQGASSTNFGSTDSAIWLRLDLHTDAHTPRHWLLEVANPALDQLDVFVSTAPGVFSHQRGGDLLPFADRPVPHRNHVKPIELEPGATTTLYLRLAGTGNVSAPTTLWQPTALWHNDQKTYSIFSLYFGLLIGLVAYNLLLLLSVRDRAYVIYVVFAACVGLSQAANSGLGAQFLWPDALWWNNKSINVAYAASGTFGILFARSFLGTRATWPALDRFMLALALLWVATIALSLLSSRRIVVLLVTGQALMAVATIVLAGIFSIWRRHPGAPYFGLAWGALFLGIVTLALHNYGLLPSNLVTANALLIGSAMEMVLLSFALADRINVARREKELAQAQVLAKQSLVQNLQQSQERYQAVIEHVGEGMVVVQNGRIVFVNFRATEILETTKSEILEQGVMRHIHPDDRAALSDRLLRRMAGEEVLERCQVRFERGQLPPKWLEFGDTQVPWDGGQGLLIFFLDVTQRHTAELQTRMALEQQREFNDLRSRFMAMTSHEFRTPLAAILSAQDLLRDFGARLPAIQHRELLDMIQLSVHRMTRMLERVLLLGQAEAHMLEFKPEPLNLQALCQDLVTEAQTQHPNNPCRVVLNFGPALPPRLYDEKLLRHILGNLLSNAIKYSPDGGEVRFKVSGHATQTEFEVADDGIGIPPDEISDLFESFHRASNVGAIIGTGLGLAIVKQSVDLHGGTIAVQSRLGDGTTFTVRLG